MESTSSAYAIAQELSTAAQIALIVPQNPAPHVVGAALALFLALEAAGKRVDIACPTPMLVETNHFVGVQHIAPKLSGKNLVLSFDYLKDAIEKVSYNVEDGKFNLVIAPKSGHKPLDYKSVSYAYSGTLGEVIALVGTTDTAVLRSVSGEDASLDDHKIFTITAVVGSTLSSEIARIIATIGMTPDQDTVNNLLRSLVLETQQFARASASDFETAAALVRAGATIPQFPTPQPMVTPESTSTDQTHEWLRPKIFSSGATPAT